jgi:hypothetical protein
MTATFNIDNEITKRFSLDDVQEIQLFIDRFIPTSLRERYPRYKQFIKYFLEYLDNGYADQNGVFNLIINLTKYFDLDYIDEELVKKDSAGNVLTEEGGKKIYTELGENLIFSFFETYVGSKESRYLSKFLDDVQYLKNQKKINQLKGTKTSFLFFFLLVLGGFFKILNISETKNHTGIWAYDGSLLYTDADEGEQITPYQYLVFSEFNPDTFSDILEVLNPAGMQPIFFIQKQITIDITQTGYESGTDFYFSNANTYIAFYKDDEFVGMGRTFTDTGYDPTEDTAETFDFLTNDGRKWIFKTSGFSYRLLDDTPGSGDSTGTSEQEDVAEDIEMLYYGVIVANEGLTGDAILSGEFNHVKLIQVNTLDLLETGLTQEEGIYSASQIDINSTATDLDILIESDISDTIEFSEINEVDFILERIAES